jgi:hypothetical protein
MLELWMAAAISTGTLAYDEPWLNQLFDGTVQSGSPADPFASRGDGPAPLPLATAPVEPSASVQAAPMADADGDGIEDEREWELAQMFAPVLVWAKGEKCGAHDTLYQIHPTGPGRVHVTYALIFPIDCGFRSSGFGGHSGDVQEIDLDVSLGDAGWAIDLVTLPWHSPFKPKGPLALFVSEGKHHIYPDLQGCLHGRFLGFDHCGDGDVERPAINEYGNVGEAAHPLTTTLERYARGPWPAGYAKETAWGPSLFGDKYFCGGDPERGGRGSFMAKLKALFGWDSCGDALDGKWTR